MSIGEKVVVVLWLERFLGFRIEPFKKEKPFFVL